METKAIKQAIDDLAIMSYLLEDDYVNNGGEVTEETERKERQIAALKELLTTEGIDSLGHWLKAKEDEVANLKAEKAYIDRKIKANAATMDYIKTVANGILKAAGVEAVKGALGYKFTRYESVKTSVVKDKLDEDFLEVATHAVRLAGIPTCIDVELKTTATRLEQDGMTQYVNRETADTCKFNKPRVAKED